MVLDPINALLFIMTEKDKQNHNNHKKNSEKSEDERLWHYVTQDVTPIDKRRDHVPAQKTEKTGATPKGDKPAALTGITPPQTPPSAPTGNIRKRAPETDHRTAERLRRGQIPIDGRLDLHGMTQHEAYDALLRYIPSAHRQGKRCILVITGKGSKRDSRLSLLEVTYGVLKQKTPQWLQESPLNSYVLRIQGARPKHGGEGALYVLLRRVRS